MIRYYVEGCSQLRAAQYQHDAVRRLRGRGPWAVTDHNGGAMMQRGESPSWGEIRDGIGGLKYQLADPLPPLMASITVDDKGSVAWVDFSGGIRLPVPLAAYAEVSFGLDGKPEGPCSEYGMIATRLWDRWQQQDLPVSDPELLSFCRLALLEQTNLTAELIHAYGLLTTKSVPRIFAAVTGCDPKKADQEGDGG
jgi:hypothetical protein